MELKILEKQIEILEKEQEACKDIGFSDSISKVLELSKGIAGLVDLKHKIKKDRASYPCSIDREGVGAAKCKENNTTPILKEGHEIDNFKEYLKREEKELENVIFEIESKGNKATIGEQSIQYEAQETIEIIGQLKQRIKSFEKNKREIQKHIGR